MKRAPDAVEPDGNGHGFDPTVAYYFDSFYAALADTPWCALPNGSGYFDERAFEYDEPEEGEA